jgi:hypothetical protein
MLSTQPPMKKSCEPQPKLLSGICISPLRSSGWTDQLDGDYTIAYHQGNLFLVEGRMAGHPGELEPTACCSVFPTAPCWRGLVSAVGFVGPAAGEFLSVAAFVTQVSVI